MIAVKQTSNREKSTHSSQQKKIRQIIRCGMNDVSDGEQPHGKNQDSYNKFKDPGTCRTIDLDLRKDASLLFLIAILE